jgi:hypothetical protein
MMAGLLQGNTVILDGKRDGNKVRGADVIIVRRVFGLEKSLKFPRCRDGSRSCPLL